MESYIWGLLLLYIVQSPRFTNIQYVIGEVLKCCACASCTIQYAIGAAFDRNPAKTPHQSQNKNRRHRIRNRIPRRPNPNRRRTHPPNRHRPPQRHPTRPRHRTSCTAAPSRNLQRGHPETVGGKLVQPAEGFRRCT